MKVLLIGSGGREHAFAWKIAQSKLLSKLFIAPGNPGTAACGENVALDVKNFEEVGTFCIQQGVELVVVGPEEPLVNGIHDYFKNNTSLNNIAVIGPQKNGAILEGSKDFSKQFMIRHSIPTARYQSFTKDTLQEGIEYLKNHPLPIVLKADGLAAGKGVLICTNRAEAIAEFEQMFNGKFGAAGNTVVVEEFLQGIELSVFVLCDGNSYITLPEAKDYKRIGENDSGLNTGGMGSVSPVPFADEAFMKKVDEKIIQPTVVGLKKENIEYIGFIFIGLMKVGDEPYVIEYNCRMGDPETESVLPRIENDLLELLIAAGKKQLHQHTLIVSKKATSTVILVSGGYPEDYEKGKLISGLDVVTEGIIFHAGTSFDTSKNIITSGGRVIACTAMGNTLKEALEISKLNARKINFDKKYFRNDIGYEFVE